MKYLIYFFIFFAAGCSNTINNEQITQEEKQFDTVYNKNYGDTTFLFQQHQDKNHIRKNPDGTIFFKTIYKVTLVTGEHKTESVLDDEIYSQNNSENSMKPSIIMSGDGKKITIFVLGKDEHQDNYGMDGYSYYLDSSLQWHKEKVFDRANIGWFSYFGGTDGDNPTLWSFSFAGYYIIKSERLSNGQWVYKKTIKLNPDEFINDSYTKEKLLITSSENAQRPSFDLESTTSSSNYSPSYSNNLSDQQITSAIKLFIAFSLYINDPNKFEKSAIDCTLQDVTTQLIDNPNASAIAAEVVHSTLSNHKFSSESAAIGAIKNNLTNELRQKGYNYFANGFEILDFTKCIVDN